MSRQPRRAKFGKAWRLRPVFIRAQLTRCLGVILNGGMICTDDWTALIDAGQVTFTRHANEHRSHP